MGRYARDNGDEHNVISRHQYEPKKYKPRRAKKADVRRFVESLTTDGDTVAALREICGDDDKLLRVAMSGQGEHSEDLEELSEELAYHFRDPCQELVGTYAACKGFICSQRAKIRKAMAPKRTKR